MSGREMAWRVFAHELGASLEEERGVGERSASFVISPLGARMNRVLVAGELGPAESAGRDPAQPFWRARLVDPTGSFTVTAGSFQPRALASLQSFAPAAPAIVVGKVQLFHGRDGTATASVRAEEVRRATPEDVRAVQTEAVELTLRRIELLERLREAPDGPPPDDGRPWPSAWLLGARTARERYPSSDPGAFRSSLRAVLAPPPAKAPGPTGAPPPTAVVRRAVPVEARSSAPPVDHGREARFLEILDELAESSDDGYADLRDVLQRGAAAGLSAESLEEVLNRLEEGGVVEEPIVGKLRRA